MFVQKSTRQIIYVLLTAALLLASCSPGATPTATLDVNAINTTIVGTTIAQFSLQATQTALAAPTETSVSLPTLALPTSADVSPTAVILPTLSFNATPVPGFTPLSTPIGPIGPTVAVPVLGYDCNEAKLVSETLPDGTIVAAGTSFTKDWQIQNIGSCTWSEGYVFTFLPDKSSGKINGYDIIIKKIGKFIAPNHSQLFTVNLTAPNKPGKYKGYWQMMSSDGTFFGPFFSLDIVVN